MLRAELLFAASLNGQLNGYLSLVASSLVVHTVWPGGAASGINFVSGYVTAQ